MSYVFTLKAGWIKVCGLIFQYKHYKCPVLFSERYGYKKFISLGLYRIRMAKDKD